MTRHPGYIKCKYCDHKVRVWYTSPKSGKVRSGWPALADHIMRDHPGHEEEAERLVEREKP